MTIETNKALFLTDAAIMTTGHICEPDACDIMTAQIPTPAKWELHLSTNFETF